MKDKHLIVAAIVACFCWQAAPAADTASQQLDKLELKFFEHTYPSDTQTARTERLEKLIFGDAVDGDVAQRVDALVTAAAKANAQSAVTAPARPSPAVDSTVTDSTATDSTMTADTNSDSDQSSGDSIQQTDYPRVDALEKAILGQTYLGQPLPTRISRMEVKLFGSASKSADLGGRTDALETATEKKLGKKIEKQPEGTETVNDDGRKAKQLLSTVGNTLLNLAGIGPMGMGMGGGPSSHSTRDNDGPDSEPQPKPMDPAITAAEPPPPTARMQIKVGWCEMRVFGQVFNNMHLEERLTQLNDTLNFKPGRKGIALMDDVASMIKLAQAKLTPAAKPRSAP